MYPLEKYKFARRPSYIDKDGIRHGESIIAISSFAGKSVKGIATCHPHDTMNEEKGKKIAALRCDIKIAEKRLARAKKKKEEARDAYDNVKGIYYNMLHYYRDSNTRLQDLKYELDEFLSDE